MAAGNPDDIWRDEKNAWIHQQPHPGLQPQLQAQLQGIQGLQGLQGQGRPPKGLPPGMDGWSVTGRQYSPAKSLSTMPPDLEGDLDVTSEVMSTFTDGTVYRPLSAAPTDMSMSMTGYPAEQQVY